MPYILSYSCNNKGHLARDCPKEILNVNLVDPSYVAGHPSCGPSPIEVDLVVETHENEVTNPVVAKVQVRGVSRGRGYSKKGRNYW